MSSPDDDKNTGSSSREMPPLEIPSKPLEEEPPSGCIVRVSPIGKKQAESKDAPSTGVQSHYRKPNRRPVSPLVTHSIRSNISPSSGRPVSPLSAALSAEKKTPPSSSSSDDKQKGKRKMMRINSSTALLSEETKPKPNPFMAAVSPSSSPTSSPLPGTTPTSPITKIQTKHGEKYFTYEDSLIRFRPKLSSIISTRPSLHCLIAASIMSLAPLIGAYNIATINTAEMTFRSCSPEEAQHLHYKWFSSCIRFDSSLLWGVAVSIFNIGALMSASLAPVISDWIGRYHVVYFSNMFNLLGIFLQIFFSNWIPFTIGRFLTGLHSGVVTIIVTMYLDEISPPSLVTVLGGAQAVGFGMGLILGSAVGIFLSGNFSWRISFLISAALSLIHLYMLPYCPQSPRFLLKQNHALKAHQTLLELRGGVHEHDGFQPFMNAENQQSLTPSRSHHNTTKATTSRSDMPHFTSPGEEASSQFQSNFTLHAPKPIENEIHILEQEMIDEQSASFRELLKWKNFRSLLICAFLNMTAPASGVVAIFYFSTSLFRPLAGLLSPSLVTLLLMATYFIGGLVSVWMMWALQRRTHLLLWDVIECLAMVGLAVSFMWADESLAAAIVSAVSTVMFLLAHSTGLGPLVGITSVEFFDHRVRGKALCILMVLQFISNISVAFIFPTLAEVLKGYVFLPFLGINLMMFAFFLFFVYPNKIQLPRDRLEKEAQNAAGKLAEESLLEVLPEHAHDVAYIKIKDRATGAWKVREMNITDAIEALQQHYEDIMATTGEEVEKSPTTTTVKDTLIGSDDDDEQQQEREKHAGAPLTLTQHSNNQEALVAALDNISQQHHNISPIH